MKVITRLFQLVLFLFSIVAPGISGATCSPPTQGIGANRTVTVQLFTLVQAGTPLTGWMPLGATAGEVSGCDHANSYYRAAVRSGAATVDGGGGSGLQQVIDGGLAYKTYALRNLSDGSVIPELAVIYRLRSATSDGSLAAPANVGSVCDTCLKTDGSGRVQLLLDARIYAIQTFGGTQGWDFTWAALPSVDMSWALGGPAESQSWDPPYASNGMFNGRIGIIPSTCDFTDAASSANLGTHVASTLGSTTTWVPFRIVMSMCFAESIKLQFNDTMVSPAADVFGTSVPGVGIQVRDPSNGNAIIKPGDTVTAIPPPFGTIDFPLGFEGALVKVGASTLAPASGNGRITVVLNYH